ncbi:MAG: YjfB family protein [Lachnoclostridium sp.]|nr:YjfB family protein [Lachnoclostridium sp.]
MDFDVASLMPNSQAQLMTQINIALLAKNLDTVKTLGDATVQMMEQSVAPHLGSQFNMTV